jgi:hypothetical protein
MFSPEVKRTKKSACVLYIVIPPLNIYHSGGKTTTITSFYFYIYNRKIITVEQRIPSGKNPPLLTQHP